MRHITGAGEQSNVKGKHLIIQKCMERIRWELALITIERRQIHGALHYTKYLTKKTRDNVMHEYDYLISLRINKLESLHNYADKCLKGEQSNG